MMYFWNTDNPPCYNKSIAFQPSIGSSTHTRNVETHTDLTSGVGAVDVCYLHGAASGQVKMCIDVEGIYNHAAM